MKGKLFFSLVFLISSLNVFALDSVPGEFIIKTRQGYSSNKGFNSAYSIEQISDVLPNVYVLKFREGAQNIKEELDNLRNDPEIEYVEPNYIYSLDTTLAERSLSLDEIRRSEDFKVEYENRAPVSDQEFKKLWGLYNKIFWIWRGPDVGAVESWEITKGSRDVKIAIIDTGIDYNHPDLKDNMMINEAEKNGEAGVDDDGNGYVDDIYGYNFSANNGDPLDDHGHGSHCAGTIGASHNSTGVAGIMGDVQLLAVKFLSRSGGGSTSNGIKAIEYAMKRGVNVMSNSWGGVNESQAMKEMIQKVHEAGIIFVAAAGNSSNDNDRKPHFPSNFPHAISVAAHTKYGFKASFSNYGDSTVHVSAPGKGIFSTFKDGGYRSLSGTSMATPHVAGVIGLLLSENPNLTPDEVKERLIKTSKPTWLLGRYTESHGRVNAFRALRNLRD